MPFGGKRLSEITESDLVALIGNEPEGKFIDYKRDPIASADIDRKEFLFDVSSFANTRGGYLLLGIEEAQGLPTAIRGLAGIDADKQIQRLEQMIRDGIRPPISGVEIATVPLANGSAVIAIRIPRSWSPPHQVTYQKAFRFYARDSNGKYQICVYELRSDFR